MKNILIAGTARNCENSLYESITTIGSAFSTTCRYRFLVVESDSTDNTRGILADLHDSLPEFDYISLGILSDLHPLRTDRIAYCRNKYLNELKINPKYKDVDFLVVADLDGINTSLTSTAVESCFSRTGWAAVFANQAGPYFDIWALRHPEWCPGDCWREFKFLHSNGLDPSISLISAVLSKQVNISATSNWIKVNSAFGGLGIYSVDFIKNAYYIGLDIQGKEVCEHVSFNSMIKINSDLLFINPMLINNKDNEHTRKHSNFFDQYHKKY